ncbi:MAG TPA: UPF0175 family protein [Candidatus Methanoperedens sp.]
MDESDVVNLYRDRKITLRKASGLVDLSLREMLDLLIEHGIKGNVTLKQQQKSLEYVDRLLES